MLYSMTNERNNAVVAMKQSASGMLSDAVAYPTEGSGTATPTVDPLGSQGSVILSEDGRFLFAVNAGSDSITTFSVGQSELQFVATAPSGGIRPNSLAAAGEFLYVTNSGVAVRASNVTGFRIGSDGRLSRVDSVPLSTANAGPGCIAASGRQLVVSEKTANILSVFLIQSGGTLTGQRLFRSMGTVPFGSAFFGNFLFVTEAGPNALSSYTLAADGELTYNSASVPNNQQATCWVSVDPTGRHAYTSNAGSGTITDYLIGSGGTLSVVENVPASSVGASAPLDSAVDRSGRFFYVLDGSSGAVSAFQIDGNGRLTLLQVFRDTKLPRVGAQGLAVS